MRNIMVKARSINFFQYACLIWLALAGVMANPGMIFGFGLTFNKTMNQPEMVSGVVTDAQTGETLPGVNVIVKGTSTGTSTNADGNYKLGVPTLSDTLIFSFVGFETKQVPVNGRTQINVALQTQTVSGEEVVVVGYGTQEKSDLTGSVATVSQERLEQVPNNNFYQALQGSVPGLLISQNTSGAEQNNQSLLIRGRTSIEASNSPLIVLDGVPYNGSISEINPADIESINVLKDASAAAIYGSRGANGVVLITTKKGQG